MGLGQRSEISAKYELVGTCVEVSMSTKITVLKSLCDKGELLDVYCIFIITQQRHKLLWTSAGTIYMELSLKNERHDAQMWEHLKLPKGYRTSNLPCYPCGDNIMFI